ncbi:MAG TPA: hypothetical protein VMO26_05590 [Vicinamibacterales bacterium]|nr:hypothetical protein [Vicinamibacterales bacterium]
MDDVVNRFARELADAIAAAVAENSEVEACRERARTAGYEMKVTLEAVVGFVNRGHEKEKEKGAPVAAKVAAASRALVPRKPAELTANDRRFLRSLRISADEAKVGEPDRPA